MTTSGVTAHEFVGIGHVVLGAMALASALWGMTMNVDQAGLGAVLVFGVLAAIGALTALAGLWLKDGQRRGALLAGALDLGRLLLLLVAGRQASILDLLLTVVLLGGVLWVLPTLATPQPSDRAGRPRG